MDAIRRSSIGFGILVIVWIVVYWWWQPADRSIAFDPDAAEHRTITVPESNSRAEPTSDRVAQISPAPTSTERPVPASADEPDRRTVLLDGVVAPRFRSYTVRRGETFESIAQRELGSRDLAAAISRANPLQDPTRLREGHVIQIPLDPTNIQGRDVRQTPAASVAVRGTEHVVKPGDTLAEISKLHYGSVAHWKLILDANRDRVKDERSIRAGQTLVIPPLPSTGDTRPGGR